METEYIQTLTQEVEKKLGRRVLSSSDCNDLFMEIELKLKIKVSFNTLRRFFGLIKANHKPSMFTLNSLSCFCGYSSFDDFVNSKKEDKSNSSGIEGSELLNYLVLLFKNTEVSSINDATYFSLVQHTIGYISHHTYLIERFQKEIATTKNGQNFYYEIFIHFDKLRTFYGDGLQFYLQKKKDVEAQIFANSLLCLKSWLTEADDDVRKYHSIVMDFTICKAMKPSVHARYFAARLFYANIIDVRDDLTLLESRQFYIALSPQKDHYTSFYCFEIILAEAMVLTGYYEGALFYLDELSKNLSKFFPSSIDIPLMEAILLFKAIIYFLEGKKQRSLELIGYILPQKFYFLSKQYQTLLYLLLKGALRNNYADVKQVDHLIKETGFTRLLLLWQNDYHQKGIHEREKFIYTVSKNGQKNEVSSI